MVRTIFRFATVTCKIRTDIICGTRTSVTASNYIDTHSVGDFATVPDSPGINVSTMPPTALGHSPHCGMVPSSWRKAMVEPKYSAAFHPTPIISTVALKVPAYGDVSSGMMTTIMTSPG